MPRRRPPSPDRIIRKQLKAFRRRVGRDPLPDEPILFDPNAPGDKPQFLDAEAVRSDTLKAMTAAGIAPEIVFAYAKTGYLIVAGFEGNFSPEALAEWESAITEYRQQVAAGKRPN